MPNQYQLEILKFLPLEIRRAKIVHDSTNIIGIMKGKLNERRLGSVA